MKSVQQIFYFKLMIKSKVKDQNSKMITAAFDFCGVLL